VSSFHAASQAGTIYNAKPIPAIIPVAVRLVIEFDTIPKESSATFSNIGVSKRKSRGREISNECLIDASNGNSITVNVNEK